MLAGSLLLDGTVRQRRIGGWCWQGRCLHLLVVTAAFGFFLAGSGNGPVAAILATALMALFTITSNAKHKMLGEPLVFSDLALIAALVRHPRFYFTAISSGQRWTLAIGAPILLLAIAGLFVPRATPHLAGLGLLIVAAGAMFLLLKSRTIGALARTPDVGADLVRLGIIATLLLYWLRWRRTPDPPVCPVLEAQREDDLSAHMVPPDLIVIVQCESFADPVELTGDHQDALSGLTHARHLAWQWGDLGVSGFGAYTMRTEYGVLFGRSEAALGFRRYDPFLTAHGETSYALSARLGGAGYHCLFVHPHDMRFYGRDQLMPAIGFDHLIGEDSFPPIADGARYVADQAVGASLGELIDKADGPTLIYAVTMENHGPWDKDRLTGSPGGLDAYLRHLRSSDAMLSQLVERMSAAGRPGLLVFFGDHRPSIPGVTEPGGARHTPYVMLRFSGEGQVQAGANARADLSPDELHHAILRCAQGRDES
jgi:Sulfatase